MRPAVSADEMRWCDEYTIKKLGVPSLLLMENAGSAVAKIVRKNYGPLDGKNVAVMCGKGNNGGDGFVIARRLLADGAHVEVFLLAEPKDLKGDAKVNYEILRKLEKVNDCLSIRRPSNAVLNKARPAIIVDAIFGTGFSGKVREPFTRTIEWVNRQKVPIVSVDIPSGVNGSTGVVENIATQATETVTFAFEKTGLLCNQGQECAGKVSVVDIGIPSNIVQSLKTRTLVLEADDVRKVLPRRPVTAHKYSVGKVFVIAGSRGLTGAAAMSSLAALRAGAGAVVLGTPETVYQILARKLNEVMVTPLAATPEGTLSEAAFGKIQEKLAWADVTILGPGLGQNSEVRNLVRRIVQTYPGKLLLDADGINAIATFGTSELKKSKAEIVLTPHSGEHARLLKMRSTELERNRVESARSGARSVGQTLVLKGAPTATALADGTVYLNSTGNPGMATAGSGDVLSGIIAGLWAQGMKGAEAAYSGVFLHGFSGDLAKKRYGERSLLAMDLIDFLPTAFQLIEGGSVS